MQEEKIERIINWLNGVKQSPFLLEIRPTYRCNLNCLSCFKHADFYEDEKNKNQNEVSKDTYSRVIKEASSLGVRECLISGGGEPLLREDTADIMCEIKSGNMKGELITNGTLFDEEKIKRLVSCGWDHIIFSIDGPNAEIHDYLRGKEGSFEKSVWAIKRFSEFKEIMRVAAPEITIATVLSNKNYNKLKNMIKLCIKNGVNRFRLQKMIVWSENGKQLQIDKTEMNKVQDSIIEALELADKHKIETNLRDFLDNESIHNSNTVDFIKQSIKSDNKTEGCFCYAPFKSISISENGRVRYCQMSDVSEENIKDKSLKEIWYGLNLDKLRKMLLKREIPAFCKNCCSPQVFETISTRERISKLKQ
jgi:MoaA/NifB/PqqE/SkfB family radical SAM enzyme